MRKYGEQEHKLIAKMISLGFKTSNKGFNYILDAVQIINGATDDTKFMNLYSDIATINNTKYSNVERDIRYAITRLYKTHVDMPSLFEPNSTSGTLTCSEFLNRLTYWLYK